MATDPALTIPADQSGAGASGASGPIDFPGGFSGPNDPAQGSASGPTSDVVPEVAHFFSVLDDDNFGIESAISIPEANEAITLFSVVNMFLAGKAKNDNAAVSTNGTKVADVLGMLTIFNGLQTTGATGTNGMEDLARRLGISSANFWTSQERVLLSIYEQLQRLGDQFQTLEKEGRRQFNIGLANGVTANVEFPSLFQRFVDLANDPALTIDIRREENNSFMDKEKLNKAVDLMVDLKGLILQIVRSLSKYGTIAMRTRNRLCAGLLADALEVLQAIATAKVTEDIDEKNPYAVLALLVGKDRDTEVAPHVVLARDGSRLLRLAIEVYKEEEGALEDYEREHLLDLFQQGSDSRQFLTTRLRGAAAVIKRYPLKNWR
ncbi:hypothetical protein QCE73_37275 [Caballeronia sp. LZ029]|uniref:hypothetical protein n=1 Tax=Caballeronia sp. LZ029 TaxID=3038564 RepID=UPI00285D48B5|nr:hypothetical protein [Caballeronia sp. LZ029]MDR5748834.1 hypothetical protein [Caballeronia sp. LZ029]